METIPLSDFQNLLKAQGVPRDDLAFICPMCGTVQSAKDFINAGVGKNFEEVEKYLGFSCVGRWTGAGSPRKRPDGKPCNYTLGGLFKINKMEILTLDGKKFPIFEPATPEQAQKHFTENQKTKGE